MRQNGYGKFAISLTFVVYLALACLAPVIVPRMAVFAQDDFAVDDAPAVKEKQVNSDWPGFLGADRNGRSAESGIIKDWSNGNLKIAWRRKLGTGYSLGSTSAGKYYQLDAQDNICNLFCLDERTGREVWKFQYEFEYEDMYGFDNGPRSSPLISDGLVYIFGVTGMLHCLDAETGKLVWKVDTQKKFGVIQNFFGVGSSPIAHGEKLIVMVGGSPAADRAKGNRLDEVTPNGTGVVIFDKRTGKVIHELVEDLASYASVNLYRDQGRVKAVAWMRNNVFGIDVHVGKPIWSFPFRARIYESVNAATPVIQGTQILLSESYGPGSILLDVKGDSPEVIWRDEKIRNRSLATHWNTPVFHRGHVYACNGENRSNCDIRCVQWQTGKVKWKKPGYQRASLTFVDDHFVVLDETGELFLIKADPGEFQLVTSYSDEQGNKLPLQYPCWAAPVISNGLLFVRGKHELVCLTLKDPR